MHAGTHQPLNKRTYRGVYVDPRLHWEALPEGAIFPPSYGNATPRISLQHLLRRIWVAPKNSGFVAWFMESMESDEQFPGTLVRQLVYLLNMGSCILWRLVQAGQPALCVGIAVVLKEQISMP